MMPTRPISRRRALHAVAALTASASPFAQAQSARTAGTARQGQLTVAQVVDLSPDQQDVSKDFLIGSRAAWQDINARGGLHGRPVQHLTLETDGSLASLRSAVRTARDSSCLVLSGTAGGAAASQLTVLLQQESLDIAHVAPWLQNASAEVDDKTFPIFAPRQDQIAHALASLSSMGVRQIGAVYASAQELALYRQDVERTAAALNLQVKTYTVEPDLRSLGQRMAPGTSAILIYIGGTPELVQFTQGLERQPRQRYVVAMADVNLQTLQQLGAARQTPVIATQVVPMVTAGLPVVRSYRTTLARLFDEPPSPLSLAGFIAARYTFEVLQTVEGAATRQSVLAAFQRRSSVDLGGFRISFTPQRRGSSYVTQSMLTTDGRIVG